MTAESVPLTAALDRARFGGKAAVLAAAGEAGLPVPQGFSLDHESAFAVAEGRLTLPLAVPSPWAVRSSAGDEDGVAASFAGQFRTVLGVSPEGLAAAVREVLDSAGEVETYRTARGLGPGAPVAVVVQTLVVPRCAGVLFTRDPLDGAVATCIEASWGLGVAVVEGAVVPDRVRVGDGTVGYVPGVKDVEWTPDGERPVTGARVRERCLAADDVRRLVELGESCEKLLGVPVDVEWAIDTEGRVWLLQARPITTLGG